MARSRNQPERNRRTLNAEERKLGARRGINNSTMAGAAMIPVDKPLTDKMKAFVKAWAEGESIPNAMQRAGYNEQPSYGYRLAKQPNILAQLKVYQAEYAEASRMTKQRVIDMQLESYEMAKLMAEPASMSKAAREIGLLCGFYEPTKIEVTTTDGRRKVEQLSDEELFAEIERLRNGAPGQERLPAP